MNTEAENFRREAHKLVDWMADYMNEVESYPVKAQVAPEEIYDQIADRMPLEGEQIGQIFEDFTSIILPGITHWQSPNFFAYFPANSSPASILAEMLMSTLGVQGMKWDTSPASTELEQRMMEWLRDAMDLPQSWSGVIHDTASTATLVALITAREQKTQFAINERGASGFGRFRVYCSEETHSSIEKGAKIAGLGRDNVVKIPTDDHLAMRTDLLEIQIESDLQSGYIPLCIVAALGTTGTMAIDPMAEIARIAEKSQVWFHVDAAYAGSALLLPEFRATVPGIEHADSFVFNPHKWLFTNFDCTAYYVRDKKLLVDTFTILPEYLKSKSDQQIDNHCDWGIPLGRRFRSLKLWFVMRHFGLRGLQERLRKHIELAAWLETQIRESEDFIIAMPRCLNLVCFQFRPVSLTRSADLNAKSDQLMETLNHTGKLYLTHTKIYGAHTLRMVIGQTNVEKRHIEQAWNVICETAAAMTNNISR